MHIDEQPIWPHSVFDDYYSEPSYVTNVHGVEHGILPVILSHHMLLMFIGNVCIIKGYTCHADELFI
jgi:hypothetical protein